MIISTNLNSSSQPLNSASIMLVRSALDVGVPDLAFSVFLIGCTECLHFTSRASSNVSVPFELPKSSEYFYYYYYYPNFDQILFYKFAVTKFLTFTVSI